MVVDPVAHLVLAILAKPTKIRRVCTLMPDLAWITGLVKCVEFSDIGVVPATRVKGRRVMYYSTVSSCEGLSDMKLF
jgi:hypothetical protein